MVISFDIDGQDETELRISETFYIKDLEKDYISLPWFRWTYWKKS